MFRIMFLTGLAFTILFLLLSIILFVKNDVAKLIGDVTGWNAKRAIKRINEKGAEEISKTQAIKTEVSNVLVRSADTTKPIHKKLELKPKQSIMAAIHEAQGKPVEEVFQAEDEMIVLAGKEVAGTEPERIMEDELTAVLGEGDELTTVLGEGDGLTTVLEEGDELTTTLGEEITTVLEEGNELTTMLADEITTVLEEGNELTAVLGDEITTVLAEGNELTTVLGEDTTTVLDKEDELTTVLGEEETTVLDGLEDSTVVIADESTSILNMAERMVMPASGEDEATDILTGEEKPLPDIFEVEDQATVVHTDESIGDEFAGE